MNSLNIHRIHTDQTLFKQFKNFQNGCTVLSGNRFKRSCLSDSIESLICHNFYQNIHRMILYGKCNTERLLHRNVNHFYFYISNFHDRPPYCKIILNLV